MLSNLLLKRRALTIKYLYFTQSLNMYVPPDEAVQDLGEINMTFEGENVVAAEHIGGDQGITSAVNPIYQE